MLNSSFLPFLPKVSPIPQPPFERNMYRRWRRALREGKGGRRNWIERGGGGRVERD